MSKEVLQKASGADSTSAEMRRTFFVQMGIPQTLVMGAFFAIFMGSSPIQKPICKPEINAHGQIDTKMRAQNVAKLIEGIESTVNRTEESLAPLAGVPTPWTSVYVGDCTLGAIDEAEAQVSKKYREELDTTGARDVAFRNITLRTQEDAGRSKGQVRMKDILQSALQRKNLCDGVLPGSIGAQECGLPFQEQTVGARV